ncbi:MAG TPA: hypothetical protein VFX30_15035 [bacterium]|nr:hypothetical protein [bacterium]
MTPLKSLKLLLVLGGFVLSLTGGCLAGTGTPAGGGAARSIFAGAPGDTPGGSSFAGPSSTGGGSGGDGLGDGPGVGEEAGTTSDTPITVFGTPLGSSNIPHCAPRGTTVFFDEAATAVTGKTDELGRREILIKSHAFVQYPSTPPEPLSMQSVFFMNPDDDKESYGMSALQTGGCVFARAFAPPEAAGKIVRLTTSVLVCADERPDIDTSGTNAVSVAALGLTLGSTWVSGTLDVALPAETVENTLSDCGAPVDVRDQIRQDAVFDQLIKQRIEYHQQGDSSKPQPYRNDVILQPAFKQ